MIERASLISTRNLSQMMELMLAKCVNALSRASLISTVPSGNPHKYWLPGLIFAGICLTILKTRFFRSFFGMLILL